MPDGSCEKAKLADADERRGWKLINFDALRIPPATFAAFVYVIATLIVGTLLIFAIIGSFRFAYETVAGELKDRVEVAKVFFPVMVALIGGPVLIWRALTAHWAAQAARRQAETGREEHFTGLFTKAVEQIGATREATKLAPQDGTTPALPVPQTITTTEPNLEVRLGAIYALERIAQDSQRDHGSIMEVLCAYARNPQNCGSAIKRPKDAFPPAAQGQLGTRQWRDWLDSLPDLRVDIQAVVSVLARRPPERVQYEREQNARLDFRSANLQCGKFQRGKFSGAIFDDANLDRAIFSFADLRGASFITAQLEQAVLMDAELDSADFGGATMCLARFRRTSAKSTMFNLANLHAAVFQEVKLIEPEFVSANLSGARFIKSVIEGASFTDGELRNVLFATVTLRDVDFTAAKLRSCIFENSHFDGEIFEGAHLHGAVFYGTDLSSARGLAEERLATAFGDASTILPEGVRRPASWPSKALSAAERQQAVR
jgi:uncharacterized protein YjbI with pentapeptide repeats